MQFVRLLHVVKFVMRCILISVPCSDVPSELSH